MFVLATLSRHRRQTKPPNSDITKAPHCISQLHSARLVQTPWLANSSRSTLRSSRVRLSHIEPFKTRYLGFHATNNASLAEQSCSSSTRTSKTRCNKWRRRLVIWSRKEKSTSELLDYILPPHTQSGYRGLVMRLAWLHSHKMSQGLMMFFFSLLGLLSKHSSLFRKIESASAW